MSTVDGNQNRTVLWSGILLGLVAGGFISFGARNLNHFVADHESTLRILMLCAACWHGLVLGWYVAWLMVSFRRSQTSMHQVLFAVFAWVGFVWASLVPGLGGRLSPFDKVSDLTFAIPVSSIGICAEVIALSVIQWHGRLNRHLTQGNHQAALRMLRPKISGKNPVPLQLIQAGTLYLKLGNVEEGDRLIDLGLARSNRDPITLTHVASARYEQKRYAEGLALTEEAEAKFGKPHEAFLWSRCLFLVALERIDEARPVWDDLVRLKDPRTLFPANNQEGQESLNRVLTAMGEIL